ncbi:hypothetical protein [Limoniibacter endophyticus]|uniref:Uncharacterized protein n=1 Tax=Limoniibacter endophyticus TaxID=1565040 RepID=A0A8J3GF56_9HYPH|nr:hypothetical protein [Limoniibacter endophyticus]GHC60500.1 hypothetical protein GCM10010136_00570 [Limoniibacter endophyticus]
MSFTSLRRIVPLVAAVLVGAATVPSHANDEVFFKSIAGQWVGPGEIIAGKYKGTKFTCTLDGSAAAKNAGMKLDGHCRVGMFTQKMQATVERKGKGYKGSFLDGADGKGLDVISGKVDGNHIVLGLAREKLKGAMLARVPSNNAMTITVSVEVDDTLVPVIGMQLKRVDGGAVGAIARN